MATLNPRTGSSHGFRGVSSGGAAVRARLTFASLVVLTTWVGEEFGSIDPRSWVYQRTVMGVPLQYLLFGGLVLLLLPVIASKPPVRVMKALKDSGLWIWCVLGLVAVLWATGRGVLNGVDELFVDWRNFLILAVVAVIASRWLAVQPWRHLVLTDMAIAYGVMAGLSLLIWALGGGSVLQGVRVPTSYGYNLMLGAFGAIVATDVLLNGHTGRLRPGYRLALGLSAFSTTLLVILGFGRALWLLLLAGVVMVALRSASGKGRRSYRTAVVATVVAVASTVAILSFGSDILVLRIQSINPVSDNSSASTNADHLGDIADAFDVVQDAPIFGFGIGSFYKTDRIAAWKAESFEVHNAYLNAWLKFGLLGLIVYLGFHVRWIQAMFRADRSGYIGMAAGGIYIVAEQVPSLIQTWPYASFQLSIHHGLILAVLVLALAGKDPDRARHDQTALSVG